MTLANELTRLAELRDRGDLSVEEFHRAKQQLLVAPAPARSGDDGAMRLYHVVTTGQRRAAWVLTVVALLFAVAAVWSGTRYGEVLEQVDAVEDATLVEGLGIRVPDPRPAIERAELQVRATAFGGFAIITGMGAVMMAAAALLIRPPKQPP